MDFAHFKTIVQSFIDSPDQLISGGGDFALQLGSELLSGSLSTRNGAIFVVEGERRSSAEEWIINRLAMLPTLADRIILSVKEQTAFVTPRADYLPSINDAHGDTLTTSPDAIVAIREFLDKRPGGTCSVLYLTSDAGEGKTTTIGQLARNQAERFKRRETDWLLVPINLGGKPFLRFDDVVVAALMNQLRFQRLYFDSFMHLVRMGVIVPALDGFEEIFVENSEGDAISSLGALINQLRAEGALLIAARKAYFEYHNLRDQAKLIDSLRETDVSFARVRLHRWGKTEFLACATEMALTDTEAEHLYSSAVSILGEDHPLVTRPVLVRKLIEVAETRTDEVLADLKPKASGYFSWLVNGLLEREANEKWLDKHGNPPRPLLTIGEHHELLSYVAEEMWTSKTSVLSGEMLESLADIYCESKALSPVFLRQIRERIKQHALIVATGVGSRDFMFDHENFKDYFLGEQLARQILGGHEDDVRRIFRAELLPEIVQQTTLELIKRDVKPAADLIEMITRVALSESASSFVRENGGLILVGLLTCARRARALVTKIVFPPDSLHGMTFEEVTFKDCYFRSTSLSNSTFRECVFEHCEFEELSTEFTQPTVEGSKMIACRFHCLRNGRDDEEREIYDPAEIELNIVAIGFETDGAISEAPLRSAGEIEDDLRIVKKVIQAFYRSTTIFETIFQKRLSVDSSRFFNHILPLLKRAGILDEISVTSRNKFRLRVPLSVLSQALSQCDGRFQCFLDKVSSQN